MTKLRARRGPKVLGIVAAVVLLLVVVGVLALDRILLSVGRKETAPLSQELSGPSRWEAWPPSSGADWA